MKSGQSTKYNIICKTLKKEEDWKKYLEVALASSHKELGHLKPTRALDKAQRKVTALLTTGGGEEGHSLAVACIFPILKC